MNTNIKDTVLLILAAVGIFVLPAVISYSFVEKRTNTFFERVDGDYEDCVKMQMKIRESFDCVEKSKEHRN
jgi:hypothetical protein